MQVGRNTVAVDATDVYAYSGILDMRHSSAGSFMVEATEVTATLGVTVTVWASNYDPSKNEDSRGLDVDPTPADAASDTGWINVTSEFTVPTISGTSSGFVVIAPTDATYDLYRLRFQRTTGAGTIKTRNSRKDSH